MIKSRMFKNLNLRKKSDRNFRGTFLKNHFRHLKLYLNPLSWLARSRFHMGTFRKTKNWNSHFWEGQPSGFCTKKLIAKLLSANYAFLFQSILNLWPVLLLEIFSSWDIKKGQFQFLVTFAAVFFWSVNCTNLICVSSHILNMIRFFLRFF